MSSDPGLLDRIAFSSRGQGTYVFVLGRVIFRHPGLGGSSDCDQVDPFLFFDNPPWIDDDRPLGESVVQEEVMIGADEIDSTFLKWGLTLIEVRIKDCEFYIVDQIGQKECRGSDCQVCLFFEGHAQDDWIHSGLPALKHENIGKPLGLPFPLLHQGIIPVKAEICLLYTSDAADE